MAKLSRSSLKALVKECLVEILAEGIGNNSRQEPASHTPRRVNKKKPASRNSRIKQETQVFENNVNKAVNSLTEDDVMKSIFSDTAKTTLQEQAGADSLSTSPGSRVSDSLTAKNSGVDLGGLFDSASQNWSSLAFSGNKTNEHNN